MPALQVLFGWQVEKFGVNAVTCSKQVWDLPKPSVQLRNWSGANGSETKRIKQLCIQLWKSPMSLKLLSSFLPSQSQLQEHTLGSSSMNADKILSSNVLETVFFVNQLFFFLNYYVYFFLVVIVVDYSVHSCCCKWATEPQDSAQYMSKIQPAPFMKISPYITI